jgi:hypothetical protein
MAVTYGYMYVLEAKKIKELTKKLPTFHEICRFITLAVVTPTLVPLLSEMNLIYILKYLFTVLMYSCFCCFVWV